LTPGISPLWAMFRKQMRQIVNLRKTARGRPQSLQRLRCRVLYFGVRIDLIFLDVLAKGNASSSRQFRNGMPKSRRSSRELSGVPFLIPIVMFMPWKCSTLSARISGNTIWSASPSE
jgi:hypothetical protein